MAGFYGEVDSSPAGFGQGNQGFSGTPLWKLKQHGLVANPSQQLAALAPTKEQEEKARQIEEMQVANVLLDSASIGELKEKGRDNKPFVRHVLVKDLRKVATRTKLALPTTGLFDNHVPVALFAMFDGQSCADVKAPGPLAAEWCCRHVHTKLLRNLVSLPPDQVNHAFVKATLIKTFEDLDRDLLTSQPSIQDGCGAALVLLVGDHLFTAVVGKCDVVLCEPPSSVAVAAGNGGEYRARSMGAKQGRCDLPEEKAYLSGRGGLVFEGHDGAALVRGPDGAVASVSRSLGDRAWKVQEHGGVGMEGMPTLLRCVPEVGAAMLSYGEGNPVIVLTAAPVTNKVSAQVVTEINTEFLMKPRAISGEVTARAALAAGPNAPAGQQCAAVTIIFLPPKSAREESKDAAPPAAKKLKVGDKKESVGSVRLRHILVRHTEASQPRDDPVRHKPVTRNGAEAEGMLRRALKELMQDQRDSKGKSKPLDAKRAAAAVANPTPTCMRLTKELSECESAAKGGGMCGDLGWVRQEELPRAFGPHFAEAAKSLSIGQWSDVVSSQHGAHLLQRIA